MTLCRQRAWAACLEYLRLRGQLWTLPAAHPARPALTAAVAHAEHRWRTLAAALAAGHSGLESARPPTQPALPAPR